MLDTVRLSAEHLSKRGIESARLDAELLVAHVLGVSRLNLYVNFERPLTDEERESARELLKRRANREPVAYIVGEKEFYSLAFEVNSDVLIPRPDTEILVETIIDLDRAGALPQGAILDIGTGSGAVSVTLAHQLREREVVATDISADALAVARRNAERHGVADRIEFIEGDLTADLCSPFAAIVSNPPYVPERERELLSAEVRHEPTVAIFSGEDGLDLIRRIVKQVPPLIMPNGWLAIEVGKGQARDVEALMVEVGLRETQIRKDLAGIERVVMGRR